MGVAEFKQVCGGSPKGCQQWEGGIKPRDGQDHDTEEEIIPIIRFHAYRVHDGQYTGNGPNW